MIKSFKKPPSQKPALSFQNWSLVTKTTNPASKPSEIRGVLGVIQQYYFSAKLGPPLNLTSNKYFKCQYFPPEHILGIFRKSSPAMRLKFNEGFIANDPTLAMSLKNKLPKSLVPADYSFMRVKIRRLYRRVFHQAYQVQEGKDGLYVFYVDLVPNTPEQHAEFQDEIEKTVDAAQNINQQSKFYKDMVRSSNLRANWNYVRKIVENEGLRYPQKLISLGAEYQALKQKLKPHTPKQTPVYVKMNKLNTSKKKIVS